MNDIPLSALRSDHGKSIVGDLIALAANHEIDFREDGQVFELPARLFEQLPFGIYVCDRDGLLVRYNRRAAELWGRSPNIEDRKERFCGSFRMFRADGSPMPHDECYMVDVLRTGTSVRQQEVHIERPDGLRGIALVDIEAIRDGDGNVIGAVNCFQDVTERKLAEEREKNLTRELDHRAKNLLAVVQAAVHLSHAYTVEELKTAINGRLKALSHAHSLLAQSRWSGADLQTLVEDELAPFRVPEAPRVVISGPAVSLRPHSAQSIAMVLHELTTNAVKYGSLSIFSGVVRIEWSCDESDLIIRWSESGGPPVERPSRQGFGTRLIGPIVQKELGGKLLLDWIRAGLVCEVVVSLDHIATPPR